MNDVMDVAVKFIPIFTLVVAIIRFFLVVNTRSIIENLILSNKSKIWESFIEMIVITLVMIVSIVTFCIIDFINLDKRVLSNLILATSGLILLCYLFLFLCWIVNLFTNKIKRIYKFITTVILSSFFLNFVMLGIITLILRPVISEIIDQKRYSELLFILLIVLSVFLSLFYSLKSINTYFYGGKTIGYRMELIEDRDIKDLVFIYSIDDERQIYSNKIIEKRKLKLPAYIYYPKEMILYKVDQIKD